MGLLERIPGLGLLLGGGAKKEEKELVIPSAISGHLGDGTQDVDVFAVTAVDKRLEGDPVMTRARMSVHDDVGGDFLALDLTRHEGGDFLSLGSGSAEAGAGLKHGPLTGYIRLSRGTAPASKKKG